MLKKTKKQIIEWVFEDQPQAIEEMLGGDLLSFRDDFGTNLIQLAYKAEASLCIDRWKQLPWLRSVDFRDRTTAGFAASVGHLDALDWVEKEGFLTVEERQEFFGCVCFQGDEQLFLSVAKKHNDLWGYESEAKEGIIHFAAQHGWPTVFMLCKEKGQLEKTDYFKRNALHFAVECGQDSIVEICFKNRWVLTLEKPNKRSHTPFGLAVFKERWDLCDSFAQTLGLETYVSTYKEQLFTAWVLAFNKSEQGREWALKQKKWPAGWQSRVGSLTSVSELEQLYEENTKMGWEDSFILKIPDVFEKKEVSGASVAFKFSSIDCVEWWLSKGAHLSADQVWPAVGSSKNKREKFKWAKKRFTSKTKQWEEMESLFKYFDIEMIKEQSQTWDENVWKMAYEFFLYDGRPMLWDWFVKQEKSLEKLLVLIQKNQLVLSVEKLVPTLFNTKYESIKTVINVNQLMDKLLESFMSRSRLFLTWINKYHLPFVEEWSKKPGRFIPPHQIYRSLGELHTKMTPRAWGILENCLIHKNREANVTSFLDNEADFFNWVSEGNVEVLETLEERGWLNQQHAINANKSYALIGKGLTFKEIQEKSWYAWVSTTTERAYEMAEWLLVRHTFCWSAVFEGSKNRATRVSPRHWSWILGEQDIVQRNEENKGLLTFVWGYLFTGFSGDVAIIERLIKKGHKLTDQYEEQSLAGYLSTQAQLPERKIKFLEKHEAACEELWALNGENTWAALFTSVLMRLSVISSGKHKKRDENYLHSVVKKLSARGAGLFEKEEFLSLLVYTIFESEVVGSGIHVKSSTFWALLKPFLPYLDKNIGIEIPDLKEKKNRVVKVKGWWFTVVLSQRIRLLCLNNLRKRGVLFNEPVDGNDLIDFMNVMAEQAKNRRFLFSAENPLGADLLVGPVVFEDIKQVFDMSKFDNPQDRITFVDWYEWWARDRLTQVGGISEIKKVRKAL